VIEIFDSIAARLARRWRVHRLVALTLYVTIREIWAWLNNSGFWRSAKDGNKKPDKKDKRDDDSEIFATLFVAEASPVAALALSLRQLIPFIEVECHW
jgi:hypothetical protein